MSLVFGIFFLLLYIVLVILIVFFELRNFGLVLDSINLKRGLGKIIF